LALAEALRVAKTVGGSQGAIGLSVTLLSRINESHRVAENEASEDIFHWL